MYSSKKLKWYTIFVSGLNLLVIPVAYMFFKLGFSPESSMTICLVFAILVQFVRLLVMRTLLPFSIKNYLVRVICPTIFVMIVSSIPPVLFTTFFHSSLWSTFTSIGISIISVSLFIWFIGLTIDEKQFVKDKFCSLYHKMCRG